MEPVKDKNLEILKTNHLLAHNKIQNFQNNSGIEVIESKDGNFVPVISKDGKRTFIHSRFDPYKEADRLLIEKETN